MTSTTAWPPPAPGRGRRGRRASACHPGQQRQRSHHPTGAHPGPEREARRLRRRRQPLRGRRQAALATDTHQLEARYLDGLVGPWPEAADVYRQRSPLTHADELKAPSTIFQRLDDKVVPPAQPEVLVDAPALRRPALRLLHVRPRAHDFRKAETIQRVMEAELSFYGQVLGFTPADDIEPVRIEHP